MPFGRLIVAMALLAACGCATAKRASYETLISHRGESDDAPENTLPAYRMAVERGFGFECDIYVSADDRIFTFHDSNLTRTTSGVCTQQCAQASWESTVSKLNVGGWGKWKGSKFDPTRPALFEEVLDLARPGRKIYVEVKSAGEKCVPLICETLLRAPKASPETVLFITFNPETCAALKRALPDYKVYFLVSVRGRAGEPAWTAERIVEKLRELGADGVDAHYAPEIVTADYIAHVKEAGFEFHVWTVDAPEKAREAFERGADSVTTNRAKYLLERLGGAN